MSQGRNASGVGGLAPGLTAEHDVVFGAGNEIRGATKCDERSVEIGLGNLRSPQAHVDGERRQATRHIVINLQQRSRGRERRNRLESLERCSLSVVRQRALDGHEGRRDARLLGFVAYRLLHSRPLRFGPRILGMRVHRGLLLLKGAHVRCRAEDARSITDLATPIRKKRPN